MTTEELKSDIKFYFSPKYAHAKLIKEIEKQERTTSDYYGWLEEHGDDVILRVWAAKRTKKKGLQYREVIRAILGEEGIIYRDMYLNYCGGYKVLYEPQNGSSSNWYGYTYYAYSEDDFGTWQWTDKIGVAINIINLELLNDTKFKYSGWQGKGGFLEWMRTYKEFPQVEYLGKLGFEPSRKLLKKAAKDKGFARYLAKVGPDHGINAICYAYDHHISIQEAGNILMEKAEAGRAFTGCTATKDLKIDLVKLHKYIKKQKFNARSYDDYIRACKGLELDMTDTKNLFPKELKRMHDLRTNQWEAKQKKAKAQEFTKAAEKYLKFETQGKDFSIIIPRKTSELKKEGKKLHHCVGRMGYDVKMIKGASFIAFVRRNDAKDVPFVTVEFGIEEKKILQCYGDHDSKPSQDVIDFTNAWSKKIKKAL